MKKNYVHPTLKSLAVSQEELLLTVSISDGNSNIDNLNEDPTDGDAGNEGLAKPFTVWD
ncbi:MAG: hypothetical protein IJ196_05455 [Prevotella sp.]|nr:hypothetical protein [Prevotella sp.]